ncbi:10351_t:CDS:1 [Funneliformis caledonium]|uniref:10351_t:CDS:1 n=1 Tax=Funneliformis caledonium TaxID=1117310 RepID=A0A9N8YUJ0_9GLOM|nr:10351_t:CDS:1 [Funneliformis caledonium]
MATTKKLQHRNLPSLPSETIDDIFKHIHDQSTLHTCLFVNRAWCRKIVAILWARPRPLVYKERSSKSLIETYVSCFDDEEKAILFSEESSNKEYLELKSPFFEYSAFLKELNYPLLRMAVRRCYRNLGSKEFSRKIKPNKPDLNPNRQVTIMKALCKLFVRTSHLDSLVLDSYDDLPSVGLFTKGQPYFTNLNKLIIHWTNTATNISGLVKRLPQICTGIRHLVVEFGIDDELEAENLASIIRAQQSITTFELTGTRNRVLSILTAIEETQTESLTSVKFSRVDYQWKSLDILGKCSKLRSLDMISDGPTSEGYISDEPTTVAKGSSFNLRSLKLSKQSPKLSAQVIRMGGISLKKLWLNTISPEIVSSILRSGTRVTHLYLDISETPQLDFSQHLKVIGGLRLNYLQLSSITPNDINNLLTAMTTTVPSTLRHLDLEQEFSLRFVGSFLKDCKAPLEELTLFPNMAIDTSYLTEIIGYAKGKSSLKFLHLNLSWESGLVNGRFTRAMTKELQKNIFTVDLGKLRGEEVQ